jgi:tryptophan-rich sensory protein
MSERFTQHVSAFIVGASVLTAAAIGGSNGPQRPSAASWYLLLRKPPYTPPGPLVGLAWTALEFLLAGAGYRLLRAPSSGARSVALTAWSGVLLGLAGYPWLFFRRKRLASSTVAAGGMLASAVGMAVAARDVDKPAAAMSLPLLVWLGFATVLSEELWRRNPRLSRD